MKRLFLVLGITALLCTIVWAEDKPANFSGTWQLDTKSSDAEPKCSSKMLGRDRYGMMIYQPCDDLGIISNALVINQTENEIKIINKIYKLDNEDKTYRASLSKRKFTVVTGGSNEIERRKVYSLSKDGRTMTLKISVINRKRKLAFESGFETWQKLVYHLKE